MPYTKRLESHLVPNDKEYWIREDVANRLWLSIFLSLHEVLLEGRVVDDQIFHGFLELAQIEAFNGIQLLEAPRKTDLLRSTDQTLLEVLHAHLQTSTLRTIYLVSSKYLRSISEI